MLNCDTLIRNARCTTAAETKRSCLTSLCTMAALCDRCVLRCNATTKHRCRRSLLAPGFIDVHTHDDTSVIETPDDAAQDSQGVTTVIVGNCGISAAPVRLTGDPPDPMNLLGRREYFRYPTFADYVARTAAARPAVNVAALVGHTALRNNHMDRLDRAATDERSQPCAPNLARRSTPARWA